MLKRSVCALAKLCLEINSPVTIYGHAPGSGRRARLGVFAADVSACVTDQTRGRGLLFRSDAPLGDAPDIVYACCH